MQSKSVNELNVFMRVIIRQANDTFEPLSTGPVPCILISVIQCLDSYPNVDYVCPPECGVT